MIPALIAAAPALIGLFTRGGSTAERVATAASDVARAVTGQSTDDAAAQALRADPARLLEYQQTMAGQALALYESETERLREVNKTMQAELCSGDAYVRRWRPTFGYIVGISWLGLMGAMAAAILVTPADAPGIIASAASLAPHWGIALAVLGVAVHERSKDKEVAAGRPPARSLLDAVTERVSGSRPAGA